jgi:hypothetical protein
MWLKQISKRSFLSPSKFLLQAGLTKVASVKSKNSIKQYSKELVEQALTKVASVKKVNSCSKGLLEQNSSETLKGNL